MKPKPRSESRKRPGKVPLYAEFPHRLAEDFKALAARTKFQLRQELEYAMRYWLSLSDAKRMRAVMDLNQQEEEERQP
jgi:hypothetical protein